MPDQLLDDHQIPTDFAVYQRFNRLEDMQAVGVAGCCLYGLSPAAEVLD